MHPSPEELVVLIDDTGEPCGTAPKATVHTADTPLHLAFSCHLIGPDGRVLVTRRAVSKRTFAGVWTNAFCGHPAPGEEIPDAVVRRAQRELGVTVSGLEVVLPEFRYCATDASGIVENEICPVYIAHVDGDPTPAADEVDAWSWVDPASLRRAVEATPFAFSPWLGDQLRAWIAFPDTPAPRPVG